ncbi:hypothetical protein SBOR_6487 [Sclerotinia borealis F-4128]|uniref:Uncharacterized protein n=1 Tax=Sclerotinia borealis (strain F-4128) TaxID=1432307 RepID=W9CEX4_SCLBF|nr:hypothetical protein SBOR_6487 [Sclerotinia borealis F-4128]
MFSGIGKDMESYPTKSFDTMTRAETVNAILRRTESLERVLLHKNTASSAENKKNGIEDETEGPEALKAEFKRRRICGKSGFEYDSEAVILKHRLIISLVNKELNNLFRYTVQARLRILNKHLQDFQVDIKNAEEYLFLLRKLDVADDKDVARKIDTAFKLMAESSTMRNSIEARIQEVYDFFSNTASENLSLETRRQMVDDLGVRHGAKGSKLSLRDHNRFPQWKYCKLFDFESLQEKGENVKNVSRQSSL